MSLYAIGDLHFSTSVNKPMNIFGSNWDGHEKKIIDNWKEVVKEEDMVLVLGNHDYWWTTVTSLNKLYEDMRFIQTNFYEYKDYAICGGRGWICPNDVKFDETDEKVYKREEHRLRLSLESARKSGHSKIIVITHYPPTNDKLEESLFTKLFEEYNVE